MYGGKLWAVDVAISTAGVEFIDTGRAGARGFVI